METIKNQGNKMNFYCSTEKKNIKIKGSRWNSTKTKGSKQKM